MRIPRSSKLHLLLVLVGFVVDDVVELELVDALGGGDDAEPVTKLLLLEELLGPRVTAPSAPALQRMGCRETKS